MFFIIKKVFVLLCLLLFMPTVSVITAKAYDGSPYVGQAYQQSEDNIIAPFWSHTHAIFVSLDIVNGRAVMMGTIFGRVGTERISVDVLLERVNSNGTTTHIASWRNIEAQGVIWQWERPHFVARGHYYRLTLISTVFRNETSETISFGRTSWAN